MTRMTKDMPTKLRDKKKCEKVIINVQDPHI